MDTDGPTPPGTPEGRRVAASTSPWEALGRAVLTFHYRVGLTAMCQCGRTVIECDVQHHARRLGLLPALPKVAASPPGGSPPPAPLSATPPGQTWPSHH